MTNLPKPLITVTIPCHNKESTIARAIESVRAQTLNNLECIIVNDSSTDNSEQVILDAIKGDKRFRYEKVQFRNVALVRNHGASLAQGNFLSFLDGDDWMEPAFLETCAEALLKDRSLAIAYTSLRWHKADGSTGISKWPDDWDFDKQLHRKNQIPTCSVMRKECWERLGGQRARYCEQLGAGSEDGEFHLRAGAYGFRAAKVTKEALFNYSWMSGLVSGEQDYNEVDWTGWHPWAGKKGDGLHPFASYASPKKIGKKSSHSHPVRQYDQPTISVIIPVGSGHEQHLVDALDSLEAQTFRRWEVVVVLDLEPVEDYGPRAKLLEPLYKAYPYVQWAWTSLLNEQPYGAGYARNRGAEKARAPLLLFLDADDWLYPQALEKMLETWNESQAIVYTDYQARSIVTTDYKNEQQQKRRLLAEFNTWTEGDQQFHYIACDGRAFDYDCERAQLQPQADENGNYYVWCNVTALIPHAWHQEIGGFDEGLESWEDVDYHWRMAKAGKCYVRIPERLMVYNYHKGHRRESGRQNHKNLLYYISEKHKELEIVACSNCGGRRRTNRAASAFSRVEEQVATVTKAVSDDHFVIARYMGKPPGNISDTQVTGPAVLDQRIDSYPMIRKRSSPDGWSINYGKHSAGDKFLVHKADIEAMPALFIPIEDRQAIAVPPVEQAPLGVPESVTGAMSEADVLAERIKNLSVHERATLDDMLVDLPGLTASDILPPSESRDMGNLDNLPDGIPLMSPGSDIVDTIQEVAQQITESAKHPAPQAIQLPQDVIDELETHKLVKPDTVPDDILASITPEPVVERVIRDDDDMDTAASAALSAFEKDITPPQSLSTDTGISNVADNILASVTPEPVRVPQPPALELQKLTGMNVGIAKQLVADGIVTKEQILALGMDGLMKYRGVAERRATMILGAAGGERTS